MSIVDMYVVMGSSLRTSNIRSISKLLSKNIVIRYINQCIKHNLVS